MMRQRLPIHPKLKIPDASFKLHKGDVVQVIGNSGGKGAKDIGKRGKILEVLKQHDMLLVEGVGKLPI